MSGFTLPVELPGIGRGLASAGLWSLALRGAGTVATFALGVQLARYLGPEQLGAYGIIVAIAMLLSAFGQLGLPTLATREVALAGARGDFAEVHSVVRWFGLAVGIASTALGLVFAIAVLFWPQENPAWGISAIFGGVLVPLFALTVLVSAHLRALGRLVLGQSLEILVRPLVNCILLLAIFIGLKSVDAELALAINTFASLAALLLGCWWLWKQIPAEARRAKSVRHARHWRKSATPLAVTDVLRQMDGVYGLLLLGLLASTYETGIFRVAQSIALVAAIPLFIVQIIVAPTLARLHAAGEGAELQALVRLAARVNFGAALAVTLLIAISGRELIHFFFGAEYVESWPALLILCAAQVVSGFFGVGFVLLPMAQAERELAASFAGSVGFGIIFAIPLIVYGGAAGAAGAVVIGALVNGLAAAYYANSRLGVRVTVTGIL